MTVLPGMTRRYLVMHSADDQRRVLRSCTVGFAEMVVGIAVLGALFLGGAPDHAAPGLVAVCGAAMAAPFLGRLARRPLDCSSDVALAESYRTRFFLRAAFANVPALAGFLVGSAGGPVWLFGLGVAIALAALFVDAPTRSHLAREDAALRARGCGRSLVAALAGGAL
jgi:nitrate reductase NapE component